MHLSTHASCAAHKNITRPPDRKSRYAFRFVSYNNIQTGSISSILFGFSCTTHVMIRHAKNSRAGIQEPRAVGICVAKTILQETSHHGKDGTMVKRLDRSVQIRYKRNGNFTINQVTGLTLFSFWFLMFPSKGVVMFLCFYILYLLGFQMKPFRCGKQMNSAWPKRPSKGSLPKLMETGITEDFFNFLVWKISGQAEETSFARLDKTQSTFSLINF